MAVRALVQLPQRAPDHPTSNQYPHADRVNNKTPQSHLILPENNGYLRYVITADKCDIDTIWQVPRCMYIGVDDHQKRKKNKK